MRLRMRKRLERDFISVDAGYWSSSSYAPSMFVAWGVNFILSARGAIAAIVAWRRLSLRV
jgi:hypothetical protein